MFPNFSFIPTDIIALAKERDELLAQLQAERKRIDVLTQELNSALKKIEQLKKTSYETGKLTPMEAEAALKIAIKAGILTEDGELTEGYKSSHEP